MPLAPPLQQVDRVFVRHGGRRLVYFGGCDYFRLASHPEVLRAFHEGAEQFGLNVAASRATTGNHVLFEKMERELARFFAVPRAALLSNGYATNLAFAQAFAGKFTHALIDERAHGSPRDAAELLGGRVTVFRHRDAADVRARLKRLPARARPLLITDGMFAHDGSVAPLREYLADLPARGVLLVDDAHGAGTLGRDGRGTPEVCGGRDARVVQTISLSKAFGVYGGAVLGSAKVVEAIRERSRLFAGNTPLPLPLVHAALAAVRLLREDRTLRERLMGNIARFGARTSRPREESAEADGLYVHGSGQRHGTRVSRSADTQINSSGRDVRAPVVAFTPRDRAESDRLRRALLRAGIHPPLIRYGGGPAYFRFALSSEHNPAQIDALAGVLSPFLRNRMTETDFRKGARRPASTASPHRFGNRGRR